MFQNLFIGDENYITQAKETSLGLSLRLSKILSWTDYWLLELRIEKGSIWNLEHSLSCYIRKRWQLLKKVY